MTSLPPSPGIRVCAFDAYGTLFDVDAAARRAAAEPGGEALADCWQRLAADWRASQLRYTWLRTIVGQHADFWEVTCQSLDWALHQSFPDGPPPVRDRLLALYRELEAYPDARPALARLREAGHGVAILSNGSNAMLQAAVASAGIGAEIDAVLSVDEVGVFKPDARVYALVTNRFGCEPAEVAFVSANGWDAACGAGFGYRSIWVNRGRIATERLPWLPEEIIGDLTAVPGVVERWANPA